MTFKKQNSTPNIFPRQKRSFVKYIESKMFLVISFFPIFKPCLSFSISCLFAKYLKNHWTDFNRT